VIAASLVACGGGSTNLIDGGELDGTTTDTTGADSGATDVATTDAATKDAGGDAPSDALDDVNHVCEAGTCMLTPGGPCESPGGPQGNGCCKCTGDTCTAFCVCAAPDTPIATPEGYRPIASLAVGDMVYSVHKGALRAVPLREISRVRVHDHVVVRTKLADGTVLRISPLHPTADGRTFSQLRMGDVLDRIAIADVRLVPYEDSYTHDILPDSDTGMYIAGGVLVGSTLWTREATMSVRT
jgi:hypothetical protein